MELYNVGITGDKKKTHKVLTFLSNFKRQCVMINKETTFHHITQNVQLLVTVQPTTMSNIHNAVQAINDYFMINIKQFKVQKNKQKQYKINHQKK